VVSYQSPLLLYPPRPYCAKPPCVCWPPLLCLWGPPIFFVRRRGGAPKSTLCLTSKNVLAPYTKKSGVPPPFSPQKIVFPTKGALPFGVPKVFPTPKEGLFGKKAPKPRFKNLLRGATQLEVSPRI